METIGPLCMFLSLVQLETLTIEKCKKMQQVISDGSEMQENPKESVTFPNLKHLGIKNMENLECFYGGSYKMAFPRLEALYLYSLKHMTKFTNGESSTAFFPRMIEFPCLEILGLEELNDKVKVLWDLHELMAEGEGQGIPFNPLPNLSQLHLMKIKLPSIVFPSLSSLKVEAVGDAKFLFSPSENDGCVGTYSQFPKLEKLTIQGDPDSAQLFEDDGSAAMLKFCGQLRSLKICSALKMEYLFSADGGFEQCQSLEKLTIIDCPNLEVIIRGGDKYKTVVFPRLKKLYLRDLEGMTNLCSISDIPLHFPSLERIHTDCCNKLESLFCGEPSQVVELPALDYMRARYCNAMKSFSTRALKAPKLRILYVSNCPEMEWFLLGNSNCTADMELPFLEDVSIENCPYMKDFSPTVQRAPRLRELYVAECDKWEWLFYGEPNQVIELSSLANVKIERCNAMKSFSTRPLKAPKLSKLTVSNCPEMVWFLLGNSNCNADLELPSLENVIIETCPNLKSFSPAVLRAPKLQRVKVDHKPYPIAEIEDFNHLLQSGNSSEQTAADKIDL